MYYDLLMIRHGATKGNLKKRYVGRTDEPLCEEGIYRLQRLAQKLRLQEVLPPRETLAARGIVWILSPMRRCVETAEILQNAGIFLAVRVPGSDGAGAASEPVQNRPKRDDLVLNKPVLTDTERTEPALPGQILVDPDLRECDFGRWENRSYRDLKDDPAYQAWIDSQGTLPFPGGEDPEAFRKRCCAAFEQCIARCRREGIDGTERAEETEKAEGTERAEETEKAEGTERAEETEKAERTERADGTDRTKGTGGAEESERTDGPDGTKTPLLILAAHGGTIMSILSKYGLDETGKKRDYFDWQLGCAQAYVCRMETGCSGQIRKILVKNRLETEE